MGSTDNTMTTKRRYSFKTQLIMLCIALCSISAIVGVGSYIGFKKVEKHFTDITESVMPKMDVVNSLKITFANTKTNLVSLAIPGISSQQEQEFMSQVKSEIEKFDKVAADYDKSKKTAEEESLWKPSLESWAKIKTLANQALDLKKQNDATAKTALSNIFSKDLPERSNEFSTQFDKLMEYEINNAVTSQLDAFEASSRTEKIMWWTIAGGMLLGILLGFYYANKVSRSIQNIAANLSENASHVSAASEEIAASSQQLAQANTEQAASLEETAASVEELSSMVNRNSENAGNTASTSNESQNKANEGKMVVEKMLVSIEEINHSNEQIMQQINESNNEMANIVKVIQEIGNRTKVINDIVFQTKLLSFNASVEAARAGEHGKGFAVVAEEVGNLAQMSGNAAKEISSMLDDSIRKVESIVNQTKTKVEHLIQDGKDKVSAGAVVARACGDILNEIVNNVSNVSTMANEISVASQEQAQGISEINKAMGQLDNVTQQNTAASNGTAKSAEDLSIQAASLNAAVAELLVTIHGNGKRKMSATEGKAVSEMTVTTKKPSENKKIIPFPKKQNLAKQNPVAEQNHVQYRKTGTDYSVPDRNDPGFSE